jgi:hypothetical protein
VIDTETPARIRRRSRPQRRVVHETVVSRPSDGLPLVLNSVATVLWDALADWHDSAELIDVLGAQFPDVGGDERSRAVAETLDLLADEDLIDRERPS